MAITVSHAGYVKRTSVDTYRHQSRGGKGRIGAKTREDDFVEHFFIASAHSYILLFTSKGRVYWLKVYEIPEAAAATRGKAHQQPRPLPGRRNAHGHRPHAQSGRSRPLRLARHQRRHGEKDRARRILQSAAFRNHRHQSRCEQRADRREAHRRQADGFPRQPRRPGHPVPRNRSPRHGPRRRRRQRHGSRQGRFRRLHGRRAGGLRNHPEGIQEPRRRISTSSKATRSANRSPR